MAASTCGAAREAPFLDRPGTGAPTCVFMTGVTKNVVTYWPGVMCIMQRLHDLGSRYPLVFAVSADEAEQAQAELDAVPELSANTTVMRWSRFPHASRLFGWARRWQGSRVLDKLNVLGSPFERVVWLDPDMLLTRNVDELCEMRGRLAAAYNAGHEARTCWSNTSRHLGDQCEGCRHHGIRRDERANTYWIRKGLDEQAAGVREGKPLCNYEVNTGVMVIEPFNRSAFDRMVDIVACGRAPSRDGSDQGVVNSLAYGHGAFDNVTFLPFRYNAIHRVQMLRGSVWRRWDPAIVHIVGNRKPWSPAARLAAGTKCNRSKECLGNPYFEQEREWLRACPQRRRLLTPHP